MPPSNLGHFSIGVGVPPKSFRTRDSRNRAQIGACVHPVSLVHIRLPVRWFEIVMLPFPSPLHSFHLPSFWPYDLLNSCSTKQKKGGGEGKGKRKKKKISIVNRDSREIEKQTRENGGKWEKQSSAVKPAKNKRKRLYPKSLLDQFHSGRPYVTTSRRKTNTPTSIPLSLTRLSPGTPLIS